MSIYNMRQFHNYRSYHVKPQDTHTHTLICLCTDIHSFALELISQTQRVLLVLE